MTHATVRSHSDPRRIIVFLDPLLLRGRSSENWTGTREKRQLRNANGKSPGNDAALGCEQTLWAARTLREVDQSFCCVCKSPEKSCRKVDISPLSVEAFHDRPKRILTAGSSESECVCTDVKGVLLRR